MLGKVLRQLRPASPSPAPRVPAGLRVYAVGDIHGRADLLAKLHDEIAADARGAASEPIVVYLGDYIDRGLDSRGVIELLLGCPPAGAAAVFLKGNHEDMLLRFLDDARIGPTWLTFGGAETLYSYGVPLCGPLGDEATLRAAQAALRERLPARHVRFLRALALRYEAGDYLFVHAGVRPGVPPEAQEAADLLWIRETFLDSTAEHGRVVVHGHSISHDVEWRPNRIGIDTGAYASGVLSCLALEGAERRLIQTRL